MIISKTIRYNDMIISKKMKELTNILSGRCFFGRLVLVPPEVTRKGLWDPQKGREELSLIKSEQKKDKKFFQEALMDPGKEKWRMLQDFAGKIC